MRVFDITARGYDRDRARLIPCFQSLYGTAVGLIPDGASRVLDLGAGTGLLSELVRSRFPEALLHLLDSSEPMLAQAEVRFREDRRVSFQLGDYMTVDWSAGLDASWGAGCDAIVSALSIHHLQDNAKKALFRRVRLALRPGGVFVNAEQILQPTTELEAAARKEWLEEVRGLGATEEQIGASLLRQTEDRCATVASQVHWLREAGFAEVRSAFEAGRFAVLFAAAPDPGPTGG